MARLRPFASVLIANRGEIAVRIARSCKALGIRSIAIYSDADAGALHSQVCDEAISIGGVASKDSYLRTDLVIDAARKSRAQAIHPGYGFLSENATFARACAEAGLAFIGPPPDAMQAVGDKIAAKQTARDAGIPVIAGYGGRDQSPDLLAREARRIGFPLLVKAAAGGGGRGMRLVRAIDEFASALEGAQREAQAAFGDPSVFLEQWVERPRHIEIQILADDMGNVMTFPERECSIQRRYQKIVEESPSTAVSPELRKRLQAAATNLTRSVGYRNAGTVEFLVDERGEHYFLEMNARLQVEHPVTEMVTGCDLVAEQLFVAAGQPVADGAVDAQGSAIEVRVYAEDTASGFLPSTGPITTFVPPQMSGVRHDVAVTTGSQVSSAYDSMIAKLIVNERSRPACIELLTRALDDYVVGGVATNIGFLRRLVSLADFKAAHTQTDFLDRHLEELLQADLEVPATCAAVGAAAYLASMQPRDADGGHDPWKSLGPWRHAASPRIDRFAEPEIAVDTRWQFGARVWRGSAGSSSAQTRALGDGALELIDASGTRKFAGWLTPTGVAVSFSGDVTRLALPGPPSAEEHAGLRHGGVGATGSVEAPMSGTIVKVAVHPGDSVSRFAVLAVMEAMKMEHSIVAPYEGTVTRVDIRPGQTVSAGETLVLLSEG